MDAITPSEWPMFSDGDVTIVLSTARHYRLHSSVLRRNSPYFAKELDKFPPAKLNAAAKREQLSPIRFELRRNNMNPIGIFERKVGLLCFVIHIHLC